MKKVDRKSPEIMEALASATIYKKQGKITARKGAPGEKITTTLANGTEETTNTVNDGDYVVTNPSGEEYIIDGATFAKHTKIPLREGANYTP